MPALGAGRTPSAEPLAWRTFTDGGLQRAADQGDPAVLYLTSKTCSYCWAMDRHVFRGPDVRRAAQDVRLLKLKLDGPLSAEARELKELYAKAGPPGLVFFDRAGRRVARRGTVDPAEFLDLLARKADLGVQHFVLDFGHPLTDEHVMRFVEQVMAPLRDH